MPLYQKKQCGSIQCRLFTNAVASIGMTAILFKLWSKMVQLRGPATFSFIPASFVMSQIKTYSQAGNCSALQLLAMAGRQKKKCSGWYTAANGCRHDKIGPNTPTSSAKRVYNVMYTYEWQDVVCQSSCHIFCTALVFKAWPNFCKVTRPCSRTKRTWKFVRKYAAVSFFAH